MTGDLYEESMRKLGLLSGEEKTREESYKGNCMFTMKNIMREQVYSQ